MEKLKLTMSGSLQSVKMQIARMQASAKKPSLRKLQLVSSRLQLDCMFGETSGQFHSEFLRKLMVLTVLTVKLSTDQEFRS